MDTGVTFGWVVPAAAVCLLLGFAAFALWFVLRLDRQRHDERAAGRGDDPPQPRPGG